jgi:hypothetical protein
LKDGVFAMTAFKWLVRLRIAANVALAVYLTFWDPQKLTAFLQIDAPADIVRAVGILYVFVTLAYLPSAIAPSRCMPNNIFVVLGPILPIILLAVVGWSSRGLLWLAAYELIFTVALNVVFRRDFVADVMAKP